MRAETTGGGIQKIRRLSSRLCAAVLLLFKAVVAQTPVTETIDLTYGGSVVLERDNGGIWRIDGVPVEDGDRYQTPAGEVYLLERQAGAWSLVALQDVLSIPLDENGEFVLPPGLELENAYDLEVLAGPGRRLHGGGDPTANAALRAPHGLALDASGKLLVADGGGNRIHAIDSETASIETLAGSGEQGYGGDGGPGTEAVLNRPTHVAADSTGRVYLTDTGNHRVRVVDPVTGAIETHAGSGVQGYGGDGGSATRALLNRPLGLAVDATGNVFVADWGNHRIRVIDPATGRIETFAGSGEQGYGGDGGPATGAALDRPMDVAVDSGGRVYVADSGNFRIRVIDPRTGVIDTFAGSGQFGFDAVFGPARQAHLASPAALAVDRSDNIYMLDATYRRVLVIDAATNVIRTFSELGDLNLVRGMAVGDAGTVYLSETNIHSGRIWVRTAVPALNIELGSMRADAGLVARPGSPAETIEFRVAEDGILRHDGKLAVKGSRILRNGREYELTQPPGGGVSVSHRPQDDGPAYALLSSELMQNIDLDTVMHLLESGASVQVVNSELQTPLQLAVKFGGPLPVIRALLDHGASIRDADADGRQPLHHTALGSGNRELASLLLDRGADPFQVDGEGRTPLELATASGNSAVASLLSERADELIVPNPSRVATWRLILGDWARNASVASVMAVLEADPDALSTELRDPRGGLLGRLVELNRDPAITRMLLVMLSESGNEPDLDLLVELSASNPNPAVARSLLDRHTGVDPTALGLALGRAARNSNPAVAALLLDRGADVNSADANGNTPFHFALANPNHAVAELLLHRGAASNVSGALQVAAGNPNPALTRLLLDHGVRVNATDRNGNSALHVAVTNPNPAVARLLLENGADPNGRNLESRTPLEMGRAGDQNPVAAQLLLDFGARRDGNPWWTGDPWLHAERGYWMSATSLSASWLARGSLSQVNRWWEELGRDALTLVNEGSWPIFGRCGFAWAALNPSVAVAERLLELGAMPCKVALGAAVQQNPNPVVTERLARYFPLSGSSSHHETDAWLLLNLAVASNSNPEVADGLIRLGASIEDQSPLERYERTPYGTGTALHTAARYNSNPGMVRLLLRRGASLTALDHGHATPLLLAWLNSRTGVAATLLRRGARHTVLPMKRLLDAEWLAEATPTQLEAQVINASNDDFRERDAADECGTTASQLIAHYTSRDGGAGYGTHFSTAWSTVFRRISNNDLQEADANGNTTLHYAVAGTAFGSPSNPTKGLLDQLVDGAEIDPAMIGGGGLRAAHYPFAGTGDLRQVSLVAKLIAERLWGDYTIDPLTDGPFPDQMIPVTRFDPCITSLPGRRVAIRKIGIGD